MKRPRPLLALPAALAGALCLLPPGALANISEKFTTSGTFIPPPGVTSVTVEVWGGGGAGGSARMNSVISSGGGGGGGAYARKNNVPVTPGVSYTITIPAAALAPAASASFASGDRVNGADITFTGDAGVSVTAAGGQGGACAVDANGNGRHGVGGAAGDGFDAAFSGGSGPSAYSNGGGGGSAASDLGNGNNGSGNNPAATKLGSDVDRNGGKGGTGVTGSNNGGAADSPGGGGGGARRNTAGGAFRGGAGGRGQIIISYAPPAIAKADNQEDLNLGASWVGGNAPGAADAAKWDHTVTSANTTFPGTDLAWGSIQIANPGGWVTVREGRTLTLAGGIDMSGATENLTLLADLALGGPSTWEIAADRTLTLGGIVSGSSNIAKQGGGTVVLTAANTYSGDTGVNGGILRLGAHDSLPSGSGKGNLAIGSGATVDLHGFSTTVNGLSGAGRVDNTAPDTTATLTVGGNNADSTFAGTLRNSGAASILNLIKTGSGQTVLSGANPFTGSATLGSGNLTLGHANALGSIRELFIGSAQLGLNSNNTVISAPITLTGNATVVAQSSGMLLTSLNGPIRGTGNLTFTTVSFTLAGADSKVSLGSADNSFEGNVTITTARDLNNMTVRLGAENAIAPTALLTLDGGDGNGGTWADLDLNGHNQTLAGLRNITRSGRLQRVYNSGGTDATLTILNATDRTFGGRLGHATAAHNHFALTKGGAGTFTLSGTNTYTGPTRVMQGTLALAGGSQTSPITIEPGAALGFVPGSPVSSTSSVTLAPHCVRILGTVQPGSEQRLMTAAGGFSGDPGLATPVPGFGLELRENNTQLWLVSTAAVASLVIDLGEGTFLEGGKFIGSGLANLPLPPLPAGSILTAISVNAVLTATNNANYASDLAILLDATPQTPGEDFLVEITNGTPKFGALVTLGWPLAANDGEGTSLIDTKTSDSWAAAGAVDLATTALYLGNAHGGPVTGGTWSGTITLQYLAPLTPGAYAAWAAENAGGQAPELDFDQDGVANGIEFFLNAPAGITTLPSPDATNTITWPNGGNLPASAYGSRFVIQTSHNLVDWTDVPAQELSTNTDGPGGSLSYRLAGPAPAFARLKVTVP